MRGWGRRSSSENVAHSRNVARWRNIAISLIDPRLANSQCAKSRVGVEKVTVISERESRGSVVIRRRKFPCHALFDSDSRRTADHDGGNTTAPKRCSTTSAWKIRFLKAIFCIVRSWANGYSSSGLSRWLASLFCFHLSLSQGTYTVAEHLGNVWTA
jgi:hypothetical protein